MTGSGHEGYTYDVTGPEALTMEETAERLTAALGRKITSRAQTPHEVRTTRDTSRLDDMEARREALTGSGVTDYEVEVYISHYLQIATGELSKVATPSSVVRTPRAEPCRLPAKASGELSKPEVAPLRKAPGASSMDLALITLKTQLKAAGRRRPSQRFKSPLLPPNSVRHQTWVVFLISSW